MQVVISDSIAKRMRMYQASIDVSTFEKGKDYKQAKKTIIIFICMSDPIGMGLPIYTFKNLCVEDVSIELGDETLKLIVVPQNWQKVRNNDGLRALLKYLWDDSKTDSFTEELDMCVTDIKYDQVISNDSLSYYFKMQDAREEGMLEGIEKGRAEERLARTLALARSFRDMGVSLDKIAQATGLSEEEIASL